MKRVIPFLACVLFISIICFNNSSCSANASPIRQSFRDTIDPQKKYTVSYTVSDWQVFLDSLGKVTYNIGMPLLVQDANPLRNTVTLFTNDIIKQLQAQIAADTLKKVKK